MSKSTIVRRRKHFALTAATAVAAALASGGWSPLARAASLTWTGGGASDSMSDSGNWGGSTPQNGDTLNFAGSTRLTPVNDFGGLTPATINFVSGASSFQINGNQIILPTHTADSTGNTVG